MTTAELQDAARRHIFYFEPTVLAGYREESHRYEVETDNFEGNVSVRSDFYASLSDDQQDDFHVDVKFGFRIKTDGNLAIAAWGKDIRTMNESQRRRWTAVQIAADQFPSTFDVRFDLWMQRYIAGNWDIEDGPIRSLSRTMAEINALTTEGVGMPLFKATETAGLMFPTTENDIAYADAHAVVYGLVIDGLDKKTIAALAAKFGIPGRFDNDKTIDALTKVVSAPSIQRIIFGPLEIVSEKRRVAAHGTRPPSKPFPARETFFKDMVSVVVGLERLRDHLASELDLNVRRCMKRTEKKRSLPRIDSSRDLMANYSIIQADQIAGKTIAKVDMGFREAIPGVHDSEVLILHFTDGSVLGIDTASNAGNLSEQHDGMAPADFHCRFDLSWVPPPKGANTPEEDH